MPFIGVKTIKTTKEQKEKLIADITRVASEDLGFPQEVFYVLVEENELENWGVGGRPLVEFMAKFQKEQKR